MSVSALSGLSPGDLRKVAAVHFALSEPVREFVDGLPEVVRSPAKDTVRPIVVGQSIRGGIDWGRTIRARGTSGGSNTIYAVRPAERAFDTPENRVLAWALQSLDAELRRIPTALHDPKVGVDDESWIADIRSMRVQIAEAEKVHWLRDVVPEAPSPRTMMRLAHSRSAFYRDLLSDLLDAYSRYVTSPGIDDLVAMLCDRFFVPNRDWKLFEILIAVRVAKGLSGIGVRLGDRLLVGTGRSPYARFSVDGLKVQLWYQSWPHSTEPSQLRRALDYYSIESDSTRPDIIIEIDNDGAVESILLEVKASKSPAYISQGIMQVFGYTAERSQAFVQIPSAAVVAPTSGAFAEQSDRSDIQCAVVSAESVSGWVLERVKQAAIAG